MASSPSFCAALSMPRANSLAVHESGSPERPRSATMRSRSASVKSAMSCRLESTGCRVESDGNPGISHMRLGLADRVGAEMEDRGGKHGGRVAVANAFDQMVERADTAAGDYRRTHRIGDGAGERDVVAGLGAVTVHRGEQDLAGASL